MYYNGWHIATDTDDAANSVLYICYAESPDGLHWTKPSLGICEFDGNTDNNIILGQETQITFDCFMVFRDDNPVCPPEEKYKAILRVEQNGYGLPLCLYAMFSADGLHFHMGRIVTKKGYFDSLNVAFWDALTGKYRCYFRWHHDKKDTDPPESIRDIRYIESADFVEWTDPVFLDFGDKEDIPLYTNAVIPYFRAPHIYVGFPSRYIEHKEWTGNFDELCGVEKRKKRMEMQPRYGLAITDCAFMCSRDGKKFLRYEEAFMRPAPENGRNWLYGDCFPARGMIVTPSAVRGAPDEISLYVMENHWMGIPTELNRYTIRMDGFVSLHADFAEECIVTKPFVFDGSELFSNFSTSARGYIYFILHCDDKIYASCKTFGNAIDRRVAFMDTEAVRSCAGKKVVLEIRMSDADIYAIRFGEQEQA